MPIPGVVLLDPSRERRLQFEGAGPLSEPEQFLFQRPHQPFCVSIPQAKRIEGARILDLMPTWLYSLNQRTPGDLVGRIISGAF